MRKLQYTVYTGPGSRGRGCSSPCGQIIAGIEAASNNAERKLKNENQFSKQCINCGVNIPYNKRTNKFCCRSCAGTYNNLNSSPNRKRGPNKSINKIRKEQVKKSNPRPKHKKVKSKTSILWKNNIVGEFSPLFICECKHCSRQFVTRKKSKYCPIHANMYKSNRSKFEFTFNVYHYPDLFNLSLIETHGWYSPGNRSPKNNDGVSRDHKISVIDAIKHNYDPYYISHPLNCNLMLHSENKSKYIKSSVNYSDLVASVNIYGGRHRSRPESVLSTDEQLSRLP